MSESVSVTIDGAEVRAEAGRLLIDVAEEMNIFVPRFCYHPGMKSVAVCRMCLVKVEGMPKLVPACATPVADGMKVDTADKAAVDAQEGMLEFLLINHPLDCPICDRGGECPLQDQTYRHGPGSSRYIEPKRTYEKALAISDLVVLDRERCVLCWRCVRFSDEIAGDAFIQLVDRGPGTQILNFSDEPFDSYFSGNTIQICPVGALTASTYRFVSRPWDLKTAPGVCGYCSVGCPLTNEARSDQLVRCQALPNENVNEFWICDKGRFAFHYVESEDRLTTPLVRGPSDEFERTTWGRAIEVAAEKIKAAKNVGVIAGGHLTTEDAFAVQRLAKKVIGTPHVDSRLQDAGAPYEVLLSHSPVAGSTATLNDLLDARTIVWVGADPKETLPVLYLRLRKAAIDGRAKIIVVSARTLSLDSVATHVIRCEAGGEAKALADLAAGAGPAASDFGDPAVVCWEPASPGRDERPVLAAALELASKLGAKVLACPPHAGSQGLIDMGVYPTLDPGYKEASDPGMDTRAILEAAAGNEIDALVLVGADPISDFPDSGLARRALERAPFVLAIELFPTPSVMHADVVFPSAAGAERDGTYTNLERRLQRLEALVASPGSARPPWEAIADLAAAMGSDFGWANIDDVWSDIRSEVPTHAGVELESLTQPLPPAALQYESGFEAHHSLRAVAGHGAGYPQGYRAGAPFQTGQNWPLSWELRAFEARGRPGVIPALPEGDSTRAREEAGVHPEARAPGKFILYTGRLLYDEGAMVSKTAVLRGLAKEPFVQMNREDIEELGLTPGDEVLVTGNGSEGRATLVASDIARGAVFVPYAQRGLAVNSLISSVNPVVEVKPA